MVLFGFVIRKNAPKVRGINNYIEILPNLDKKRIFALSLYTNGGFYFPNGFNAESARLPPPILFIVFINLRMSLNCFSN